MNKRLTILSITAIIGLGGIIYKMVHPAETPQGEPKADATEIVDSVAPVMAPVVDAGKEAKSATQVSVMTLTTDPEAKAKVWKDFAHKEEVEKYHGLQGKVFLSDEDKKFRQELFADERMLKSLEILLKTPATDRAQETLQNAALDILLESLQASDSGIAAEILKNIVADNLVEDTSLPKETREALGGIKAEIVFQFTSLYPDSVAEIEGMLPGPASQKIWSNVKARQQSNLAESTLELKE
ncbi:MAG TPA: hypothetical protein VGE46_05160 [Bdellovibrio sp.]